MVEFCTGIPIRFINLEQAIFRRHTTRKQFGRCNNNLMAVLPVRREDEFGPENPDKYTRHYGLSFPELSLTLTTAKIAKGFLANGEKVGLSIEDDIDSRIFILSPYFNDFDGLLIRASQDRGAVLLQRTVLPDRFAPTVEIGYWKRAIENLGIGNQFGDYSGTAGGAAIGWIDKGMKKFLDSHILEHDNRGNLRYGCPEWGDCKLDFDIQSTVGPRHLFPNVFTNRLVGVEETLRESRADKSADLRVQVQSTATSIITNMWTYEAFLLSMASLPINSTDRWMGLLNGYPPPLPVGLKSPSWVVSTRENSSALPLSFNTAIETTCLTIIFVCGSLSFLCWLFWEPNRVKTE